MKYKVSYNTGLNGFIFTAKNDENAFEVAKNYEKQYGSILFLDRIEEIRIYNRSD
ncbi:MAG: hypothetical protein WC917_04945 [Bacilli bacterium]|jgi:hypothetical protein